MKITKMQKNAEQKRSEKYRKTKQTWHNIGIKIR